MSKVERITSKLDSVFKQTNGLSSEEYNKIIFNIELLKKKYFKPRFKDNKTNLYEGLNFKEFIKVYKNSI